jgi:hypothetical protein
VKQEACVKDEELAVAATLANHDEEFAADTALAATQNHVNVRHYRKDVDVKQIERNTAG